MLEKNLRLLRTTSGWTHGEMAEKVGVKIYSYKSWEYGAAEPNIACLIKLADIFNVTVDDLIRYELELKVVPELKIIRKKPE